MAKKNYSYMFVGFLLLLFITTACQPSTPLEEKIEYQKFIDYNQDFRDLYTFQEANVHIKASGKIESMETQISSLEEQGYEMTKERTYLQQIKRRNKLNTMDSEAIEFIESARDLEVVENISSYLIGLLQSELESLNNLSQEEIEFLYLDFDYDIEEKINQVTENIQGMQEALEILSEGIIPNLKIIEIDTSMDFSAFSLLSSVKLELTYDSQLSLEDPIIKLILTKNEEIIEEAEYSYTFSDPTNTIGKVMPIFKLKPGEDYLLKAEVIKFEKVYAEDTKEFTA
jgi:hypothetical protein